MGVVSTYLSLRMLIKLYLLEERHTVCLVSAHFSTNKQYLTCIDIIRALQALAGSDYQQALVKALLEEIPGQLVDYYQVYFLAASELRRNRSMIGCLFFLFR